MSVRSCVRDFPSPCLLFPYSSPTCAHQTVILPFISEAFLTTHQSSQNWGNTMIFGSYILSYWHCMAHLNKETTPQIELSLSVRERYVWRWFKHQNWCAVFYSIWRFMSQWAMSHFKGSIQGVTWVPWILISKLSFLYLTWLFTRINSKPKDFIFKGILLSL